MLLAIVWVFVNKAVYFISEIKEFKILMHGERKISHKNVLICHDKKNYSKLDFRKTLFL